MILVKPNQLRTSNHEVVPPELKLIVLPSPVEPSATPSISTPPRHVMTDSQPPSETETTPKVRKSSRMRNPPR